MQDKHDKRDETAYFVRPLEHDVKWGVTLGIFAGVLLVIVGGVALGLQGVYSRESPRAVIGTLVRGYLLGGFLGGFALGAGRRYLRSDLGTTAVGAITGVAAAFPVSTMFYGDLNQWAWWQFLFVIAWGAFVGGVSGHRHWSQQQDTRTRRR